MVRQDIAEREPSLDSQRKRALMVADMTTFMARLVFKLTQTAVVFANNIIQKTEELNLKFPEQAYGKIEPIILNETDLVEFNSNTQLLESEELSIP